MRAVKLFALGLLACAAALLVVLRAPSEDRRPADGGARAEGPNVVLVVLDTMRRDRLSLYGYGRPTSPNLERLAASATVFDQAYSTSSWTCPAHASLFTGLYPWAHGVTQAAWDLPAEQVTLAERLRARGYRTAGMVGNPMIGRQLGFDQGFDQYHETWRERPAADGRHPALEHLERFVADGDRRPFFAFLNFIEPHSPYVSLGNHAGEFVPPDGPAITQNHWRAYFLGRKTFTPAEVEMLGHRYDAELRHTDDLMGQLVDLLEGQGVLERTVLVITSDHGENLGEHGLFDHVFSLYETTVAVPLLVRYPPAFAAGARVERPVQLVDVFATLASLTGLEDAAGHGLDLRSSDGPPRPVLLSYDYPNQALGAMGEDAHDPRLDPYRRRLFALREGDLKLILGDDGQVELYDLEQDGGELHDLAASGDPRLAPLLARIEELLVGPSRTGRRSASEPATGPDAETLAELRSLGYAE